MTERTCCYIHPKGPALEGLKGRIAAPEGPCGKPAEWELWPSNVQYEFVDSCTDHVGHLLDDAPETTVRPVSTRSGMGGEPGIRKMA